MSGKFRSFAGSVLLVATATVAQGQQKGLAPLQAKLAEVYVSMMGTVIPELASGEAAMLNASGMKDDAAKLTATAAKAKEGASQSPNKEKFTSSATDVKNGSANLEKQAGEFSSEAKVEFAKGAAQYVDGVVKLKNMSGDADQLSNLIAPATQGLSMVDAARAKGTVDLAKAVKDGVPTLTANTIGGLAALKAFMTSRGIPVPPDLDSLVK